MGLYTIVFLFRGGTYISQFSAESEAEALNQWSLNPDEEMLSGIGFAGKRTKWISKIRSKFEDEDFSTVSLDGIKSVWFTHFLIGRSGVFINVIKTMH
jgi:hypothetical protein